MWHNKIVAYVCARAARKREGEEGKRQTDSEKERREKRGEQKEREIAKLPVRTPTIMQSSTPGPRVNDRRTATNLDVCTSV